MRQFVNMRNVVAATVMALVWSTAAQAAFNIVPEPQHVTARHGAFVLHAGERIEAPSDKHSQWIAGFLRDRVADQTGIRLDVGEPPSRGEIVLRIDPAIQGRGAYNLDVTPAQVTITAASDRGLFWGVQTLRQLLPVKRGTTLGIPAVAIADAPRFPWRGLMLDVSRHFYPVSFVEKQIDLMSYYKFDVFHWHLTDDQGWRIQIKRYPKLTSVGAWRMEPDGTRYGGFYTQQQIREVVAYAKARNVMVVPEIEMPGHTSAAIAAYPRLSCNDKPIDAPTTWGITRNADCIGNADTFKFLDNVLAEVVKLFPSPYVHIGGDEVPADVWRDCASCQQLAKEHGLVGEPGLHSYFVRRIGDFLKSKGKTLVGWDEILEGGVSPGSVVEVWHLPGGEWGGSDTTLRTALSNGNRVILAGPFYLDTRIDNMTLQDVYRNDPFRDALFAKYPGKVIGGEAALWSEHATPLNGAARLYPRLLAISGQFWGSPDRDWAAFLERVRAQKAWLASQHVAYGPDAKDIVDYRLAFNPTYRRWRIRAARGIDDLRLHYTINGNAPTDASPWFKDVLDLYHAGNVTIAPFLGDVQYQAPVTFDFVRTLALGSRVTAATSPVQGYQDQLTDGVLGNTDLDRNGLSAASRWVVWPASGMDVTLDLGEARTVHLIEADFLQAPDMPARVPASVSFQVSYDGKAWTTLPRVQLNVSYAKNDIVSIYHASRPLPKPEPVRYIRVVGTASAPGQIACDEVVVH